jgi:hypothetical protein
VRAGKDSPEAVSLAVTLGEDQVEVRDQEAVRVLVVGTSPLNSRQRSKLAGPKEVVVSEPGLP